MQAIETYVPITQAKAKLLDMVRQLHDTNDTIAITKNGVPEAVLLSMKRFNASSGKGYLASKRGREKA